MESIHVLFGLEWLLNGSWTQFGLSKSMQVVYKHTKSPPNHHFIMSSQEPLDTAKRIRGKSSLSGNYCCVPGCTNRSGRDQKNGLKRSYYKLPNSIKYPKLRKAWINAIPRKDWDPNAPSVRVCSDHFVGNKKSVQPDTPGYVPSIWPHKQDSTKPRTTNTAKRTSQTPGLQSSKRPRYIDPASCPTCVDRHLNVNVKQHLKDVSQKLKNAVWQTTDHDYVATRQAPPSQFDDRDREIHRLKEENARLQRKILSVDSIKHDNKQCTKYTGMPSYDHFSEVFEYLKRRSGGNLKYWRGSLATSKHKHFSEAFNIKPGPLRKLSLEDEFFLCLVKLKLGSTNYDLAQRFDISETLVSIITSTWFNFMEKQFKLLFEMNDSDENVAECFKDFDGLKVVVDCTEQQVQRSSDLQARKETFSNYKQRDTLKWMIGLSKNLTVNYCSAAFGGRASDKFITNSSDTLLNKLKPGNKMMSDRGFPPPEDLKAVGVEVIIPTFKGRNRNQLTKEEVEHSEYVAKARIHVERIIQRIRTYHILDATAQLSQKDIYGQMFTCVAYLVNFHTPIIAPVEELEHVDNIFC